MSHDLPRIDVRTLPDKTVLRLNGAWRTTHLDRIERRWKEVGASLPKTLPVIVDVSGVEPIDTGAMLFFIEMRESLKKRGSRVRVKGAGEAFCRMFRLVRRFGRVPTSKRPRFSFASEALADLGKAVERLVEDFRLFLNFLGALTLSLLAVLARPTSIRFRETASNLYKAGVTALPIVALSSFLVGVVVAYQSAVQLEKYGANIFIVDMIGISIPRELAPLITAIIVAGRSGSAYTAQIGVMKITEELDAMKTMGFGIFRFVVLPRVFAMVVALPLLIFFADVVGIYAGMLVAKAQLGINPAQFLDRLQSAVDVRHYLVGVFKAPFFAFIIAAIGCFRGFQVAGNTESVGRYTTMSVVNAIFLVVAADAIFSVIFTELDI